MSEKSDSKPVPRSSRKAAAAASSAAPAATTPPAAPVAATPVVAAPSAPVAPVVAAAPAAAPTTPAQTDIPLWANYLNTAADSLTGDTLLMVVNGLFKRAEPMLIALKKKFGPDSIWGALPPGLVKNVREFRDFLTKEILGEEKPVPAPVAPVVAAAPAAAPTTPPAAPVVTPIVAVPTPPAAPAAAAPAPRPAMPARVAPVARTAPPATPARAVAHTPVAAPRPAVATRPAAPAAPARPTGVRIAPRPAAPAIPPRPVGERITRFTPPADPRLLHSGYGKAPVNGAWVYGKFDDQDPPREDHYHAESVPIKEQDSNRPHHLRCKAQDPSITTPWVSDNGRFCTRRKVAGTAGCPDHLHECAKCHQVTAVDGHADCSSCYELARPRHDQVDGGETQDTGAAEADAADAALDALPDDGGDGGEELPVTRMECQFENGTPDHEGSDQYGAFSFDENGHCQLPDATPAQSGKPKKEGKYMCPRHQEGSVRAYDLAERDKAR